MMALSTAVQRVPLLVLVVESMMVTVPAVVTEQLAGVGKVRTLFEPSWRRVVVVVISHFLVVIRLLVVRVVARGRRQRWHVTRS